VTRQHAGRPPHSSPLPVYVRLSSARACTHCAFPRLSRLAASVTEAGGASGIAPNEQMRVAVAGLAAKARDHAALLVGDHQYGAPTAAGVLAAAAAIPGLRHLSWKRSWHTWHGAAAAPPRAWARLAASLGSLELAGPLAVFGYAEPLAALTGLTRLFLAIPPKNAGSKGGTSSAPARAARALARLPWLAHLRITSPESPDKSSGWGRPAVAAELARCPALRLLEIDSCRSALWRHERVPACGLGPPSSIVPRPPSAWSPFAQALRAGGSVATVQPAPEESLSMLWFEI
jgi:hypothetical protein